MSGRVRHLNFKVARLFARSGRVAVSGRVGSGRAFKFQSGPLSHPTFRPIGGSGSHGRVPGTRGRLGPPDISPDRVGWACRVGSGILISKMAPVTHPTFRPMGGSGSHGRVPGTRRQLGPPDFSPDRVGWACRVGSGILISKMAPVTHPTFRPMGGSGSHGRVPGTRGRLGPPPPPPSCGPLAPHFVLRSEQTDSCSSVHEVAR